MLFAGFCFITVPSPWSSLQVSSGWGIAVRVYGRVESNSALFVKICKCAPRGKNNPWLYLKEKKLMVTLELSSGHLQLRKRIASYLEIAFNNVLRAYKKPFLPTCQRYMAKLHAKQEISLDIALLALRIWKYSQNTVTSLYHVSSLPAACRKAWIQLAFWRHKQLTALCNCMGSSYLQVGARMNIRTTTIQKYK